MILFWRQESYGAGSFVLDFNQHSRHTVEIEFVLGWNNVDRFPCVAPETISTTPWFAAKQAKLLEKARSSNMMALTKGNK